MNKQGLSSLAVLILLMALAVFANCQEPAKLDLYEKVFVSAGIDISKLSPEEQTKLKSLLGQAMVYSHGQGRVEGYKEGMEASGKITTELLDDYYLIRKSELEELIPAKPSKLQRVAAALKGFGDGMRQAQAQQSYQFQQQYQSQPSPFTSERRKELICKPRLGFPGQTKCEEW